MLKANTRSSILVLCQKQSPLLEPSQSCSHPSTFQVLFLTKNRMFRSTLLGRSEGPFLDGGFKDRTGLQSWRERRRNQRKSVEVPDAIVHLIRRSSPFSGTERVRETGEKRVSLLYSEKSGRNFFSFGDYQKEMIETFQRLTPTISGASHRIKRKTRVF